MKSAEEKGFSPYKRILPIGEITLKLLPENEKFTTIPGRLFYHLTKWRGVEVWKRCDQGRYNLMAKNGYLVSYVDHAMIADED